MGKAWCLGGAMVAAALAPIGLAGATSASRAPEASHALAARPCGPGQLAVWIDTQGSGAAGSVYYHLRFTNISTGACTLTGYPGVSAVNAAGRRLGKPASRDTQHVPKHVTLAGVPLEKGEPVGLGGSASAVLRIVDADNYPGPRCGRATAAALRVFPPNQHKARLVSLPFVACARTSAPLLSVEAVQAGLPTP